jgi:hypothetical protein
MGVAETIVGVGGGTVREVLGFTSQLFLFLAYYSHICAQNVFSLLPKSLSKRIFNSDIILNIIYY